MKRMSFHCNFCHKGTQPISNDQLSQLTTSPLVDLPITPHPKPHSSPPHPKPNPKPHSSPTGSTRRQRIWDNIKLKTSRLRVRRSLDSSSCSPPSPMRGLLPRQDSGEVFEGQGTGEDGILASGNGTQGGEGEGMRSRLSTMTAVMRDTFTGKHLQQEESSTVRSYTLDVWLQEGRDLAVRDSCGTSDPYVKFKIGNRLYYRSRTVLKNLNPKWDERFQLPVEDLSKAVVVKVYDYDRALTDDPMGFAHIDPAQLKPNVPTDLKLLLMEENKKGATCCHLGYISVQCTLLTKQYQESEQFFRQAFKGGPRGSKKLKVQEWYSVVNVALLEGVNLLPMDENGLSDPYVKFRLGNEKYKSKHRQKTLNPEWFEQFDLYQFSHQSSHLEINVLDYNVGGRANNMGRAEIDLSSLEQERTHDLWQPLEDGAGALHILLTISGTLPHQGRQPGQPQGRQTGPNLPGLNNAEGKENDPIINYSFLNSFQNLQDVGLLKVRVIRARDLTAADIGGKSDPYCVLELDNIRLRTHTEYKTLTPEWNKVFVFNIQDIHSVLSVTVYDEDRDKKSEFLGKLQVPLLRINRREIRWYNLKDKKLLQPMKGSIELEFDFVFNQIKAAIRTITPRSEVYLRTEPRFKVAVMQHNIERVAKIIGSILHFKDFFEDCFSWRSKSRSSVAFLVFMFVVWNFEVYLIPVTLLTIFLLNLLIMNLRGEFNQERIDREITNVPDEDEDEEKETKDDKKAQTFREKLQSVQEVCLQVQESMEMMACLGERIKNAFRWSVPWLSIFGILILSLVTLVLYLVPLRYLVLAWGINRFTRPIRAPGVVPNNEILDYLSRLPSDLELIEQHEFESSQSSLTTTKKKRS